MAKELEKEKQQLNEIEKNKEKFENLLETARKMPEELLSKTKIPIEGLSVKDGNVVINGLTIDNLSTSEQIKLAVDIAKLNAKELKIICIDRFESLDDKTKKDFFEHIKDDDFQYFITEVSDDENVEIVNLNGENIIKDNVKDENLDDEAKEIFGW
jgi:disulfide oxidoreductase YuzD